MNIEMRGRLKGKLGHYSGSQRKNHQAEFYKHEDGLSDKSQDAGGESM